jgi:ORF6N domain-containing protein
MISDTSGMEKDRSLRKIETAIYLVRGRRVMLDSDLAEIYGVSTRRLNEQLRRNLRRFPKDFAFQLSAREFRNLMSQFATSSFHGGRRKLPWVFSEHGAIMLASILNGPVAVAASVRVVRAFVKLREMIAANGQLSHRLTELERKMDTHDEAIVELFAAIRRLLEPPTPKEKREIGFHVRERDAVYRVSGTKAA